MTRELTEVRAEISERLTGKAAAYWRGAAPDVINEYLIIAQRQGVGAAIDAICDYVDDDEE